MQNNLRIGIIGLVHDHVWKTIRELQNLPGVDITCVADFNKPLLNKISNLGLSTYQSYEDLI